MIYPASPTQFIIYVFYSVYGKGYSFDYQSDLM